MELNKNGAPQIESRDNIPEIYDGGVCFVERPPSQDLRGEEPAPGSTEEDEKGKAAELGVNLAFSRNWREVRVVGGPRASNRMRRGEVGWDLTDGLGFRGPFSCVLSLSHLKGAGGGLRVIMGANHKMSVTSDLSWGGGLYGLTSCPLSSVPALWWAEPGERREGSPGYP